MLIQIPSPLPGFNSLHIETENQFKENPMELFHPLPEFGLGIVGTRYPQRRSFELLEKTIQELGHSNLIIISGFARGIDSKAHELALEYGLKTIAILGCGLKIDYPKENRNLRKKILEKGGFIISPFPLSAPPLPHHFLNRNQFIAHFSKAVWVVEAASISGSLNTANHAFRQNRDLYATPCFPNDPLFEGNQKLLSQNDPEKYPIAEPFFGAQSLLKTWANLPIPDNKKPVFDRSEMSRIQKWVYEIGSSQGECHNQNLMQHALNQGLTPGEFFREFKENLDEKKISEDRTGRVVLL